MPDYVCCLIDNKNEARSKLDAEESSHVGIRFSYLGRVGAYKPERAAEYFAHMHANPFHRETLIAVRDVDKRFDWVFKHRRNDSGVIQPIELLSVNKSKEKK